MEVPSICRICPRSAPIGRALHFSPVRRHRACDPRRRVTMQGVPLNGIIGACLTPFDDQGNIDYGALEQEIEFIVQDADAISIAAVEAAEYTVLTLEDRKQLMRRAVEMVGRRLPVILGASNPSIRTSVSLCEYAAQLGADYVQVLMPLRPWGGQPSAQELYDYFGEIALHS